MWRDVSFIRRRLGCEADCANGITASCLFKHFLKKKLPLLGGVSPGAAKFQTAVV